MFVSREHSSRVIWRRISHLLAFALVYLPILISCAKNDKFTQNPNVASATMQGVWPTWVPENQQRGIVISVATENYFLTYGGQVSALHGFVNERKALENQSTSELVDPSKPAEFSVKTVTFDGVPATKIELDSMGQITAITPKMSPGEKTVVVTSISGLTMQRTILVIGSAQSTSLTPAVGSVNGNTTVTINGSGFGTAADVTFNGVRATVDSQSDSQIIVRTPANPVMIAKVIVAPKEPYADPELNATSAFEYINAPSGLSAPNINGIVQSPLTSAPPTVTGSYITFSIDSSTPLHRGLSVDKKTGVISGTPTESGDRNVTLVATNPAGSTSVSVRVQIAEIPPSNLVYGGPYTFIKNRSETTGPPNYSGGTPTNFTITPSLPSGLNINASTGEISGTASALSVLTVYTVTASNAGGATTANVSIRVNDAAPTSLTYGLNPATYTKGIAIPFNNPSNSGGAITNYSVSPGLPSGLTLNTSTGVISGTPTAISAPATFIVTGSNVTGSTTASLVIGVNDAAPASLSYPTNPAVYTKGVAIANNVPSSTGGAITSYSVSPALPAGLSLNASTGVISGTPTAITAMATYTVTGTNTGGSISAGLTITVNDAAPTNLKYSEDPAVYTKDAPIANNTPSNTGGAITSYSVSPALPAGLSLNTSTGVISGTPTSITPMATYTVTGTNTGGSTSVGVSITVNDVAPSNLKYSQNPAVYTKDVAIANNTPSNTGGVIKSYSVSPALPAGLSLNTSTGIISGTPTAVTPLATYVVTATNTGGSTTANVSITVNDAAPKSLTYSDNPAIYTKGVAITANVPSSGGGSVISYSVSPALPLGLTLNNSTGFITGTPTAITSTANYTVTATNSGGSTTASLSITVNDAAPASLSYSQNPAVYTKDVAIAANNPSSSGGAVVSYSVSPALPAGLTLNASTGIISGTPTAITALASYTVTATNSGGSTTASLSITVNDAAPKNLAYLNNPATYTKGSPIAANTPSSNGGAVVSYSVSPALPAGLSLNGSTGVITGTPTVTSAAASYVVTATNTGGSATVSLTITVNDAAPGGLTYSTNPAIYTVGSSILNNTPSSTGGVITGYSVSPTLPAGLSLSPLTGIISGTPTAVTALATYTVTGTNVTGSTSVGLVITVNAVPPSSITYTPNDFSFTVNTPSTTGKPVVTGGAASFSVSPALPAGLSIDPSTGEIAGTPTVLSTTTVYTITAANSGGSATDQIKITVVDKAPSALTYSTNPAVYEKGKAIAANTPSSAGGAVVSYSVSPSLPAGLSLNTSTGVITGTPTAVTATASYVVTATNTGGSTTASLSITVNDVAPSSLAYSMNPATYTKGTAITANVPSSAGGAVTSYSASSLPAGLSINAVTGVITGTPTAVSGATNYTITASNTGGSTTATLSITVNDIAPSSLAYSTNPAIYVKGTAIPPNSPTSGGGAVVSYSVNPALPAGLSLNSSTGVITGTPTAVTATASYVVTATNSGGSTTATLSITVNDAAPAGLTYSDNPATYTKGIAITANVPSSTGGAITSYSVSPSLPTGLSLNTSTGIITGTPTATSAAADYTVTASNVTGSTTVKVNITVNDAAPAGLTYAFNPAVYTVGSAITNNTPFSTGGAITAYSVNPALPAGLSLSPLTGIISGTPTAVTAAATYTVTGTNATGSTTVGVVITVNDEAPSSISYSRDDYTVTIGTGFTSGKPNVTGGAVTNFSVFPSLPTGISIDASTGEISGTPTVLSPTQVYTITGMNSGGSATAQVKITVVDNAPSGLAYGTNPAIYTKGTAIAPNSPSSSGGAVISYSLGSALPAGLTLNTSTGVITGTPTAVAAAADYIVTATNSGGSTTVTLKMAVNDVAPSGLTYSANPAVYTKNVAITPNTPSLAGGGAVTAYSVSPALPSGLSLNPLSGVVTGTPTIAASVATYTFTALNSGGSTTAAVKITVMEPAPTLSSISPTAGPLAGGVVLNLTGTGFLAGLTVTVGGNDCFGATLISSTSAKCNVPAGAAGKADVVLTNPDGQTATLSKAFLYQDPPVLSSVSPSVGPSSGGQTIALNGSGFLSGITVTIGGANCPNVNFGGSTSFKCDPAAHANGTYDVTVTNPDGQSSTLVGGYTYLDAPTVTSVSPAMGPASGGTAVTITGTNFSNVNSVGFGTSGATSIVVVNSTTITAVTPAHAAGPVSVSVNTPGGIGTLANAFMYVAAPTISSISPSAGTTAGGTDTTITGSGFQNGIKATIDGVSCTVTTYVDSSTIGCRTPMHLAEGAVNVGVTNPDTQWATLVNGFNYVKAANFTYSTTSLTLTKDIVMSPLSPNSVGGTIVSYSVTPSLPAGISLNTSTGVISGTPTVIAAVKTYSITGTNPGGSKTVTLDITVNDQAPIIAYPGTPFVFTKGTGVGTNSPTSSGGAVLSYSISPALPSGLAFNTVTGAITGTPTVLQTTGVKYTVTATNSGGTGSTIINITINDIPPSSLSYSMNPATYTKGTAITPNNPTSSGGTVVAYSVSPALPAGLSLDVITGIISGTPTAVSGNMSYLVTASNSGGSTTASVWIAVNDIPPMGLAYAVNPATYTKGVAITPNTLSYTGGAPTSCSVSPALPAGLSLNTVDCTVSGTPTVIASSNTYTVTATNSGGSNQVGLTFKVNDAPPTNLTYTADNAVYAIGTTISPNSPTSGGGPVVFYSISPGLPAGLSFNTSTGVISGTPTQVSPMTSYIITATNSGGSTTAVISITVNDIPPSDLTYNPNPATYTQGVAITNNTPSSSGGAVVSYSIDLLPAGLNFNTSTGVISGTPTVSSPTTNYTVKATNSGGTTFTTLTITVSSASIPSISFLAPSTLNANQANSHVVTAKGSNFTGVTDVTLNGVSISEFTVVNSTTLKFNAPPMSPGSYPVVFTNASGSSVPVALSYVSPGASTPTITSINPSSGPTSGGQAVLISGTNFNGSTKASIGGVACNISGFTTTSITCVTGPSAAGLKDVYVYNNAGGATLSCAYVYGPNTVASSVASTSGSYADFSFDRVNPKAGPKTVHWAGRNASDKHQNDGADLLDPPSGAWAAMNDIPNAPAARSGQATKFNHAGEKMLVFGGKDDSQYFADAGLFNINLGVWETDPTQGAGAPGSANGPPTARAHPTIIWTGTEYIIWGGEDASGALADGARYNPTTKVWAAIPVSGGVPARYYHSAIWTGTEMIIFGGLASPGVALGDGHRYNPTTGIWTPLNLTGAPLARYKHGMTYVPPVSSGFPRFLVIGGLDKTGAALGTGAVYTLKDNLWTSTPLNLPYTNGEAVAINLPNRPTTARVFVATSGSGAAGNIGFLDLQEKCSVVVAENEFGFSRNPIWGAAWHSINSLLIQNAHANFTNCNQLPYTWVTGVTQPTYGLENDFRATLNYDGPGEIVSGCNYNFAVGSRYGTEFYDQFVTPPTP